MWTLGLAPPDLKVLVNVSGIVVGVMIAAYGEIDFVMKGFIIQMAGIIFEATRLALINALLSGSEFKMDPLVSFYYFAPVCAVMNGVIALFVEVPTMHMTDIYNVGLMTLLANAMVAFALNVALVTLVSFMLKRERSRLTVFLRLARPPLSCLLYAVSSRISCLLPPQSSSLAPPSRSLNGSVTALPSLAWSTTSLATTRSQAMRATAAACGPSTGPPTPLSARWSSLVPSSFSSSCLLAVLELPVVLTPRALSRRAPSCSRASPGVERLATRMCQPDIGAK